jgi:tetratricopeptide (TPR) repeat protein
MQQPMKLPCNHQFCMPCIQGMQKHMCDSCPLCRAPIPNAQQLVNEAVQLLVRLGRLNDQTQAMTIVGRAEPLLRRAIEIDPKHAGAYYNLGCALNEKGETGRAIEAWCHAITLDDSESSPMRIQASINIGNAGQAMRSPDSTAH